VKTDVTTLDSLEYTPVEPSECGNYWVTPDGKKHRPLQPKHKKFCQLYVQGMSGAEAARRAGFTKHKFGAKAQGSALLRRNPLIANHIIDLMKKEHERAAVSMESHLTELSLLRDEARDSGQISSAISAEVSRGRAAGLYIEKKEVTVSKIETMSDDELRSRLQQLLDGSNMKVLNDVPYREEFVPSPEEQSDQGPLAKDRDGSAPAGGA
jgi:phage terminase small subunit